MLLAACGPVDSLGSQDPSASPSGTGPVVSPTAAPPAFASEARLEGLYELKLIQVSTNVLGTPGRLNDRWTIASDCETGACDVAIEVDSDGSTSDAALVNGRYRWTQRWANYYWCGSGKKRDDIPSVAEFSIQPTEFGLIDGAWVVTEFEGTRLTHGLTATSCDRPSERYAIRGVRI